MVQHSQDAEDLVQEVLLKLWVQREGLRRYQSLEALSMRMMKNQCLNYLKANRREVFDVAGQEAAALALPPDRQLEQEDGLQQLHRLIARLPLQQRLVLQLRDVEELEMAEVAEIAEISLNNARATLSLARKRMRELYRNQPDPGAG
jgi:RNA polymerase sigma-70 factor (ECF subfamily)